MVFNLTEYSDNYSKTSGILLRYCRDEPAVNGAECHIYDLYAGNTTNNLFQIKEKITDKTCNNGTKGIENNCTIKRSQ